MAGKQRQEADPSRREANGIFARSGEPVFAVACALGVLCFVFLALDMHWTSAIGKLKTLFGLSGPVEEILSSLPAYSDIMIAVVVAIIVALLSITITMYVFLKSALDRVIDENQYIAVAANIYQNESSAKLFWVSILNFVPILLAMLWHFLLNFQSAHDFCKVEIGLALLAFSLVLDAVVTVRFWKKCIRVRTELQMIIKKELARCVADTKCFFKDEEEKEKIHQLIGYWTQWETDEIERKVVKEDQQLKWNVEDAKKAEMSAYAKTLCSEMKADQFINLFSRTEVMLLAGTHRGSKQVFDESDIITAIQERRSILNPMIVKKPNETSVEELDLNEYHYIGNERENGSPEVLDYIWKFRQMVGYQIRPEGESDKLNFFSSTEKLYRLLKRYRDLKISERYTPEWRKKSGSDDLEEIMVMGQYYFLLRVLALFVSAVQISDFTFNGSTLNFANFYNSTLKNVSLYSTQFYHTIFTRTKFSHVVMDISEFDSVNFYYTSFHDVSLNNSIFSKVKFERAQMDQSSLNSCAFRDCQLTSSSLTDSMLNGSKFSRSSLISVDLSRSKLTHIIWEETQLSSCSFQNAELQGWTWKNDETDQDFKNCNFSGSVWEDMELCDMDMSDSVFSNASMVQVKFRRVVLKNTLFQGCQLPSSEFYDCKQFDHSSFRGANLFKAYFENCELKLSNLYMVSAGDATFKRCSLDDSDCAEASFREAVLEEVSFRYARLYNTTLNWANIKQCDCRYALADHMQVTFAKCEDTKFNYASMLECNFSGTLFEKCSFNGCNLYGMTATEVMMYDCKLKQVNFIGTRFVRAKIKAENDDCKIISDCDFSKCKFELSELSGITFQNCNFSGVMFSNCKLENVTFSNCTAVLQGRSAFLTRKNTSLLFATSSLKNVTFRSASKLSLPYGISRPAPGSPPPWRSR